jgi:predicted ester cyclase
MSEVTSTNKALMRRMYEEMWNRGNPPLAAELFAQPQGVERFVSGFLSSFPDLQHTVEGMLAEDGAVAVRFSAKGTHTGQWMQFKPTQRAIHYAGVTWARIDGNRIVEHYTAWDKAGLIRQVEGENIV